MSDGKHSSDEEFDMDSIPYKKILIIIGIIIVVIGAICGVYFGVKAYIEKDNEEETSAVVEEEIMPVAIEGYPVLGQLLIEKLEVEQYILDSTEDKALENGVVKLYGGKINQIGNFCIAGHNYDKVFKKLNELEIEDTICIISRKGEKVEYAITGIFDIEPEDLTCLLSNEEVEEVTLITCENGAMTRLVVKAEKVEEEV